MNLYTYFTNADTYESYKTAKNKFLNNLTKSNKELRKRVMNILNFHNVVNIRFTSTDGNFWEYAPSIDEDDNIIGGITEENLYDNLLDYYTHPEWDVDYETSYGIGIDERNMNGPGHYTVRTLMVLNKDGTESFFEKNIQHCEYNIKQHMKKC